jgi:hypothetical protein
MIEEIIKVICEGQGLNYQSLLSTSRKREIVYARQLIMYFANQMDYGSFVDIGKIFNQGSSNAFHAVQTIENYIETDRWKRAKIVEYSKKLGDNKYQITNLLKSLKADILQTEQRMAEIKYTVEKLEVHINNLIN